VAKTWLIGRLLSKTKREKTGKKGRRSIVESIASKKGTETGKGGRDTVDRPTALPNMKGRRQERKTTGCNRSLDRSVAKNASCNNKK